ncbi:MAG: alanine racemase [Kiritimatiellae bacterium]|nr:alanine racemase [Kiritimatiellia bacterium]
MNLKRRVWVEVDLGKLKSNYTKIAAAVKPANVLCVMKANAYGLGVRPYAMALASAGCTAFGVAEPFEALELLEALRETPTDRPPSVQILSSILPDEIAPMVKAGVILPVIDLATAKLIDAAAKQLKTVAKVHFKLDTGMGRLGILAAEAPRVIRQVKRLKHLDCEGIFSHCPMAYDPANEFTNDQIDLFRTILKDLAEDGITFKTVHIAASDAINNFPRAAKPPFNQVRTGINLHGSFDPNGRRALNVESVLTLKTRVAQVRELPAGTTLGYGRTWCLAKKTRVATISAGYADGLPLALTNRGHVLIQGHPCPVIGRISMDYTTVDVTHAPNVKPGDEVVCLGGTGKYAITPDDWGALKGTHAYEIICSFGNRVERVYR